MELKEVEGFDFKYAMNIFQDEEILKVILNDFFESLDELCEKLNGLFDVIREEDNIALYRMEVHALKSTSASVGALSISDQARELERAAIDQNISLIEKKHPDLIEDIRKHKERLATILFEENVKEDAKDTEKGFFEMLKIYLLNYDMNSADILNEEIQKYKYSDEIEPLVDKLNNQMFHLETGEAVETINEILRLW